jgi:hypothetical protein
MTAKIRNESALAMLYGQPRDNYQGEFVPPVAEVRAPVRLVNFRKFSDGVLMLVNDGGDVRIFKVDKLDSPGLELLSAQDRANVQSALVAGKREVASV